MDRKRSAYNLKSIYILISECQNQNKESIMQLIIKFKPLIQKYSQKLNYDGADTDIIIFILEMIPNIPIGKNYKIKSDVCIVNYICNSIRHEFIYLSKKNNKIVSMETKLNTDILISSNDELTENNVFISCLLDNLTEIQRQIITKIFIEDISENTISKQYSISRQAVNRTKNRALKVLKNQLT